jgi:prepilin-type N-terminal cleavage/methylation domain-containing protein
MPRLPLFRRKSFFRPRAAFTLIELLIVIAIVAILATVVILVINPVEISRRARDSSRSSDLNTINKALSIYETDQPSGNLGSATVVYVSVPDSSATCANLGLPTLPGGYTYACATTANYRKPDGTGWVPVPFTSISSGSPIGTLPIDPINTTSTGLYYTYIPGGSWELNAIPESTAHKLGGDKDKTSTDGGDAPGQMEMGTDLALLPIEYGDTGLIAYWNFEEGTGNTTTTDHGGGGHNGTWAGTGGHYTTGKVGSYAGSFDGSSDSIAVSTGSSQANFSFCAWVQSVNPNGVGNPDGMSNIISASGDSIAQYTSVFSSKFQTAAWRSATTIWTANTWYFVCFTFSASSNSLRLYTNGNLEFDGTSATTYAGGYITKIGRYQDAAIRYLNGKMDDIRAWKRILSSAEIAALYNATK